MNKAALISVSDRSGLPVLARALTEAGYTLLTTSGTTRFLQSEGIATLPIEEYTGQREILDGRVKTLHPRIHGGLLARRDDPKHLQQIAEEGILPIDIAVINLYPFEQGLAGEKVARPREMIELIDVGGPTMIRAAAKNFGSVLPVIDPADYPAVISFLRSGEAPGGSVLNWRRQMAEKVFTTLAHYDLTIASYLSNVTMTEQSAVVDTGTAFTLGPVTGMVLRRTQALRYGENPHQRAAMYQPVGSAQPGWEQLSGKELSYNNLLDFDATLRMIRALPLSAGPAVVIVKHLNPCGAARGGTLLEALQRAKRCDPRSHFGGIIAFNGPVTAEAAAEVREDFAEIVLAPDFEPSALEVLTRNKNLRVLRYGPEEGERFEVRTIAGGALVQLRDLVLSDPGSLEVVSSRRPEDRELRDLQFAWTMCAHVKSNAIVLAREGMLIGVGAGQMSRIDSVELAISKARHHGHTLTGAVAASDAFFPFTDNIETLAAAGVTAVVAPGGAKRDGEVISLADKLGLALILTGDRHFRH